MSDNIAQSAAQSTEPALLTMHDNAPGLSEISYRVGTYQTILERLKTYLATHRSQRSGAHSIDLYADENWVLGLLEAWAMVTDILAFYQERIANEGYLQTATELRSVQELTGLIGYEPRPGVAASTYLTFTVRAAADDPTRRTIIPGGTAVQSIPTLTQKVGLPPDILKQPDPAQQPQMFETSEDFEARVEWNAILPNISAFKRQHNLRRDAKTMRLAGLKTGLRVGDALLIVGARETAATGTQEAWLFAILTQIETNRTKGYTQVTWEDCVQDQHDPHDILIQSPHVFTLPQKAALYGYPQGGIHVSPLDPAHWSPASIGLPATAVHALVMNSAGQLFAATDKGVFRSSNHGAQWEEIKSGLMSTKVSALAISEDGQLYAGTSTGNVFCSLDNGENWKLLVSKPATSVKFLGSAVPGQKIATTSLPKSVIRNMLAFVENSTLKLAVAMDDGVFLSTNQGTSWQQIHPGMLRKDDTPDGSGWCFATEPSKKKNFVGMDTGVFPLADIPPLVPPWLSYALGAVVVLLLLLGLLVLGNQVAFGGLLKNFSLLTDMIGTFVLNYALTTFFVLLACLIVLALIVLGRFIESRVRKKPVPPAGKVYALAFQRDGTLLAGTEKGLFQSHDQARSWQQVAHGPTKSVQALETRAEKYLFAGTQDGELWRSSDNGAHWEQVSVSPPLVDIQALLVDAESIFVAGAPGGTGTDGQWSSFQVQSKEIYLDKVYPAIGTGNWIILRQDQQVARYKVVSVDASANNDYKKSNKITRVCTDHDDALATFDRGKAVLFAQGESCVVYNDEPVEGDAILFERLVPDLVTGHPLIVSGQRARIRVVFAASSTTQPVLTSIDGLRHVPLDPDDTYVLMALSPGAATDTTIVTLRDRNGFIGIMTIGTDAMLLYEPANDDDEKIGEMVRVLQSTRQGEQTLVTLESPLLNAYDRSTVTISANVVAATHGQTVQNEAVNGIDQSGAYHRYSLKQSPLTYVPATTPDGIQSTLTLFVNQVRWHEVSTIQALMSTRRAYLLQRDSKGNTWIVFSEGSQGAYLFTGKEQITATYRVGIGEAGNVAASSLTMLRTRPPGIQGVTNPIAASGGTEPDGLEQMRSTAPLQVRSMQRIVSLNDYAYFIRMFAGISKVQTTTAWNGPTRRIYITIAGADGEEIKKDSELYTNLQAAIHAATSMPSVPVSLDSYELLYFQLKANLVLDPDWQDQKEAVLASVTQALSATFCFESRDLSQNVSASEVISVIQRIQGVAAVDLEDLYIRGKDQVVAFNALLEAKLGRVEGGKFLPAQLLVVNASSDDGIILSVEGN